MHTMIPPRAGRREWLGLAVLMLPTLLIVMDLTVLHLAVPHLSADLKPITAQLLWMLALMAVAVLRDAQMHVETDHFPEAECVSAA